MSAHRNRSRFGPLFGIIALLVVFAVAVDWMLGPAEEQEVPDSPALSKPAELPVVESAPDVCRRIEAAGNREPGFSQRCVVDTTQGAPFYRLTLRGPYGDDEGLVIILLLTELARLDEAAGSLVSIVRLVRPDPDALFQGSTTVYMSAIRECSRKDDRICMLGLIARPDEPASAR